MTGTEFPKSAQRTGIQGGGLPPIIRLLRGGMGGFFRGSSIVGLVLALLVVYGAYFWLVRRVVVHHGQVLVLLKKDGSRSMPGDQVVIPRPPDTKDAAAYAAWEKTYGDCNGILEQVYLEGTYFGFSPFDYERSVIDVGMATIPSDKVGLVFKKFGDALPAGQVMSDPAKNQRGPLPIVLQPGTRNNDYANPYAYEVKLVPQVRIESGHRGVVAIMAGRPAGNPNDYLVADGEQGVQHKPEPEGLQSVNLFQKRVKPVSIQSQRFEMKGDDQITFPSSDSFDIRLEGFVEWRIKENELPLRYVQYSTGGDLIPYLEETVILPYARSFCRLIGSEYTARDFISGDTKLKFQSEFETKLRKQCEMQGIEILQALVRDIVPPDAIKNPINEREIAKQQIKTLEQQMVVAKSQADFATQTEMANQNQAIGDANKQVVSVVKLAEQNRGVALTKAQQELAVAKLQLQAAQQQADALIAQGRAEANVVLLQKQAEADPLRQQVAAFGDGNAYAQYFFFQKLAPSVKSILTNTDGPFADLFHQLSAPLKAPVNSASQKQLTEAGHDTH
ncbi:MAG TPA: SPFH domain-containing protein [Tepidisphaeraceae bacterium]